MSHYAVPLLRDADDGNQIQNLTMTNSFLVKIALFDDDQNVALKVADPSPLDMEWLDQTQQPHA